MTPFFWYCNEFEVWNYWIFPYFFECQFRPVGLLKPMYALLITC